MAEWKWTAIYEDGSSISQYNGKKFRDIDQSILSQFVMSSPDFPQKYTLLFQPHDMKLICFLRTYGRFDDPNFREEFFIFGYENDKGKVLNVITPDGNLITTDREFVYG